MKDLNQTLEDIIDRLERIESALGLKALTGQPTDAVGDTAIAEGDNPFLAGDTDGGSQNAGERKPSLSAATADVPSIARVLGLGGGLALVSAGGYVIKLCIDSGWLTPERQVMMVAIAGIALMFSGFFFPKIDRKYSTALPVTGLILNYLAIAGGCSYYHLINEGLAVALVMGATVLGLFISQTFNSVVLSYLAIVGIYSAPVAFKSWASCYR